MSAQEWLGLILTTLSIVALIAGAVKWYIQTHLKPMEYKIEELFEAIDDIRKETKTNGGSSMRDEIKFIKTEQQDAKEKRKAQSDKIDHLYDLFVDYLANNSK